SRRSAQRGTPVGPRVSDPTAEEGGWLGRTKIRVRFHELDPYGHVNHGVYLNYFETARTELLDDLGYGLDVLQDRGLAIVVVEANIRFRAPAEAGDVLTVDTRVTEVRRASSWWHQRLTRDGTVLADLDVRAAMTTLDGRVTAAPDDLRATILGR
ncbi:MAG: thioesterase family protein, partial [Nitriliruptorales bacterium]|nr:thioesterase family protein [Nitriliruptorales bacterium]